MKQYARHLKDDEVAIFLLHGVTDCTDTQVRNYTRKHLPRADFVALLSALAETGTPVSMDEVAASRLEGTPLPRRAFAITFDDGFENNYSIAAPILADFGIPATFYVTSGFVEENRMSWTDRIELAVEAIAEGALDLPWGSRRFSGIEGRIALLEDIRAQVKTTPGLDPDAVATSVQEQLGMAPVRASDHPLDQKLSWAQVAALGSEFTVGGHSHNHGILAFLDDAALARELDLSLSLLRSRGGIDTTHYSYPEGLAHCYDQRVIDGLKSRGIQCSPSAIEGTNPPDIDLFNLRRLAVI